MSSLGISKSIIYSLLPLVLLAVLLESIFRVVEIWRPPLPVDYGWGFDAGSRLFIPDAKAPDTLITAPHKRVSFQDQYFKMPKPANTFRVFFVGGSSINYARGAIRSLALRMAVRYADLCRFEFINAGGCGYGTHRLAPLVAELLDYQPDLIVFYEGNNEFQEQEQLQFVRLWSLPLQRALYMSAFCRFVRDRTAMLRVNALRRERNRELLRLSPEENGSTRLKNFTPEQIDERMAVFEQNLLLIVSMCRMRNVPIILSSVPSNLCNPRLANGAELDTIRGFFARGQFEEGARYSREVLKRSMRHQASDTENAIIRKIAREKNVPLADVEAKIIAAEPHHVPGETLFTDWCHLNEQGMDRMMEAFEERITDQIEWKRMSQTGKTAP